MDCGIIGLGTMGTSLLHNLSTKYNISIYNRTPTKTSDAAKYFKCKPFYNIEEFVSSLSKPRKIIVIVASNALDQVLDQLKLDNEDVVIDMGNTFYKETEERMQKYNFNIIGCGISGGEKGAIKGPSLMPSGNYEAYKKVEDLLNSLNDNRCEYLGELGCGHFVKMVHNGIEYGNMSIIAEIHLLLRKYCDNKDIAKIFGEWNKKHQSYLLEICEGILKNEMLEHVDDVVNNKGTGVWTVMSGMEYQANVNILCSAVGERLISSSKKLRLDFMKNINNIIDNTNPKIHENVKVGDIVSYCYNTFVLCTTMSYLQGLKLIQQTSTLKNYNLDMKKVLNAWKHGCIIRSNDIDVMEKMIDNHENSRIFIDMYKEHIEGLRMFNTIAIGLRCSIPTVMSALSYIDGLGSDVGSLLAAMRDCFGAHGVDLKNGEKNVHIDWE